MSFDYNVEYNELHKFQDARMNLINWLDGCNSNDSRVDY